MRIGTGDLELEHLESLAAADWIRASLTTFARSVASFVPGEFESCVRIYHPFGTGADAFLTSSTWRELAAEAGRVIGDPAEGEQFALKGVPNAQAAFGDLPRALIEILLVHLIPATTTPAECYYAVWEGFGGLALPRGLRPKLELPHRAYHLFTGRVSGALVSFGSFPCQQSANLWWPADHAWCVATEVDFAWTYVGGSRACVDAILADPRLEAVETSAAARW